MNYLNGIYFKSKYKPSSKRKGECSIIIDNYLIIFGDWDLEYNYVKFIQMLFVFIVLNVKRIYVFIVNQNINLMI